MEPKKAADTKTAIRKEDEPKSNAIKKFINKETSKGKEEL